RAVGPNPLVRGASVHHRARSPGLEAVDARLKIFPPLPLAAPTELVLVQADGSVEIEILRRQRLCAHAQRNGDEIVCYDASLPSDPGLCIGRKSEFLERLQPAGVWNERAVPNEARTEHGAKSAEVLA